MFSYLWMQSETTISDNKNNQIKIKMIGNNWWKLRSHQLTVWCLRQESQGNSYLSSAVHQTWRRQCWGLCWHLKNWVKVIKCVIKSHLQYTPTTCRNYVFTLASNGYSFICVLLKSHSDKSRSTSPKKQFRPKVSLCHTEMFNFWVFNTSIGILNYR